MPSSPSQPQGSKSDPIAALLKRDRDDWNTLWKNPEQDAFSGVPRFWANAYQNTDQLWQSINGLRFSDCNTRLKHLLDSLPNEQCRSWTNDFIPYLRNISINLVVSGLRKLLSGRVTDEAFLSEAGVAALLAAELPESIASAVPRLTFQTTQTDTLADHLAQKICATAGRDPVQNSIPAVFRSALAYAELGRSLGPVYFPVVPGANLGEQAGVLKAEVIVADIETLASMQPSTVASGQTSVWFMPWTPFEPGNTAVLEDLAIGLRNAGWLGQEEGLILNILPTAAVPSSRLFEGPSLGIAVALAAYAAKHGLALRPLVATGRVLANGNIDSVRYVAQKWRVVSSFAERCFPTQDSSLMFIYCPDAQDAILAETDTRIAVKCINRNESLSDLPQRIGVPLHDFFLDWQERYQTPLVELQNQWAGGNVGDSFNDADFYRALVPWDESPVLGTIGGEIASLWEEWDKSPSSRSDRAAEASEIILSTPFHNKPLVAKDALTRAASLLSAFLGQQRTRHIADLSNRQVHLRHTRFPVPIPIDLAAWRGLCKESGFEPRAVEVLTRLVCEAVSGQQQPSPIHQMAYKDDGWCTLLTGVQSALSGEDHLAFIIIDSDVQGHLEFKEAARKDLIKFCGMIRPHGHTSQPKQCLILIAPNIHVQRWWQEGLARDLHMGFDE